jgi:predicted ATPase
MKIIHWLEISNFKSYCSSGRIPLEHPSVLIGPNNCGKPTALQAIALWTMTLRTCPQRSQVWTAQAGMPKRQVAYCV